MFRVFIDSNIIIEALIDESAAARAILRLAAISLFQLWTSQTCIDDINRFLNRLNQPGLNDEFANIIRETGLQISPNASNDFLNQVTRRFLPAMRDVDDIPVLASALIMQPLPNVILSGNTAHFNEEVAMRAEISILTAQSFLDELAEIL